MTRNDLAADIAQFHSDPLRYAKYCFPWGEGSLSSVRGPRKWQATAFDAIRKHLESDKRFEPFLMAVASGHGIGKTAWISMLIDWALDTCPDTRIVVTANTDTQLRTKTWPEVSKWTRLALTSDWHEVTATAITVKDKGHERMWRADMIPWSENNTEAFAGLHNEGKRIVVIFDEASSISDKIWEVTEGALTDANTEIIWIAFGNPTRNTGRFRECFGKYKHRWHTFQIDSRKVEGTNKAQLDKWVEDYGEDSDFVRVRVRGEFPRAGSSQFIAGDTVHDARQRNLDPTGYAKVLTVDVARFGEDRTVIGLRQGMKFQILDTLRGKSTVETTNQVCGRIHEHQIRLCVIDGDGIGGGVVDQVRDREKAYFSQPEHSLVEFHGGETPRDPHMYFNRRAEVWGLARDWLKEGDIPDDPELGDDLTGPEYGFSNKNQIQLEKKDDMKKRGLSSPDKGDTLAMSFAFQAPAKTHRERVREELEEALDETQRHFIRLRETVAREKQGSKEWWD